jgi:hypothetical protein
MRRRSAAEPARRSTHHPVRKRKASDIDVAIT